MFGNLELFGVALFCLLTASLSHLLALRGLRPFVLVPGQSDAWTVGLTLGSVWLAASILAAAGASLAATTSLGLAVGAATSLLLGWVAWTLLPRQVQAHRRAREARSAHGE